MIDILVFNGFEKAESNYGLRVIARFLRGNTSGQFKRLLMGPKLEKLTADGDRAAARLERRARGARV